MRPSWFFPIFTKKITKMRSLFLLLTNNGEKTEELCLQKNKCMHKLVILSLLFLVFGCAKHDEKNKHYYRAIHERDTAYLSINKVDEQFYGQLEFSYGGRNIKDSGTVSGFIKKDTLRGNFNFAPYSGGKNKRRPIILLEKNGKLLLGKGATYTLFNIAYFRKDIPFDFTNPEFVFEEIKDK